MVASRKAQNRGEAEHTGSDFQTTAMHKPLQKPRVARPFGINNHDRRGRVLRFHLVIMDSRLAPEPAIGPGGPVGRVPE